MITKADWWQTCPHCPHSMMFHDGDGVEESFSCCAGECDCRWDHA